MLRTMFYTKDGTVRTDIPVEELKTCLASPDGLLWVDFEDTRPEVDEPIMREVFGFHPLAIEDALQQSHIPKLDDWEDYLYIVLHSVAYDGKHGGVVDTLELDIFLGKNHIVTHHDQKIPALDRVWESTLREQRHIKNGVDRLLYRITDEVILSYLPIVDELDDAIDQAEDQVFDNPSPRTLEQIFNLKRSVIHLRRVIGPQREVLNKLARDDYAVIEARTRIYFRDVYDHLVRLYDIVESSRDLVGGALDTYLSVINNRMNDIMKTLTVITTLFMPITFLTGFFGMNFFSPGPALFTWTHKFVFLFMLLLMIAIPTSMMLWIRRRGWL